MKQKEKKSGGHGQIDVFDEIIVDNFAGGGGASTGIELAAGRVVNIAINHDPDAILMHRTNHPYTEHIQASVWDVDPEEVCRGRPVGLAWFSPDCKHFSKAKGAALVDRNIRGLAWIVLRWAGIVRPRVIILENVAREVSTFLMTVVRVTRLKDWKIIPMCRRNLRSAAPCSVITSISSTVSLPSVMSCMRLMVRMRVDLPAPDRPMMATNSPWSMVRLMSFRA